MRGEIEVAIRLGSIFPNCNWVNGETHESAKSDDIAWASDGRASAISIRAAMAGDGVGINARGVCTL